MAQNRIPESLFDAIVASAHTAITISFNSRGLDVPFEEISDEAMSVARAVEPHIAKALRNAAMAMPEGLASATENPLTDKERAVMVWRIQGKPRKEQAEALGVTVSALNSRLEKVVKRLGADNQMHAMAICIRKGWI